MDCWFGANTFRGILPYEVLATNCKYYRHGKSLAALADNITMNAYKLGGRPAPPQEFQDEAYKTRHISK